MSGSGPLAAHCTRPHILGKSYLRSGQFFCCLHCYTYIVQWLNDDVERFKELNKWDLYMKHNCIQLYCIVFNLLHWTVRTCGFNELTSPKYCMQVKTWHFGKSSLFIISVDAGYCLDIIRLHLRKNYFKKNSEKKSPNYVYINGPNVGIHTF